MSYALTESECRLQAAHALLQAEPGGMFADYALHLLRLGLDGTPAVRPVIAALEVGIAKRDVTEAIAQLAPLLPKPAPAEIA